MLKNSTTIFIIILSLISNLLLGQDKLKDFETGYNLYLKGEFYKAIKYFDKSIQKNPEHGDSHYFKALLLARTGELDKALPIFNKAISINPKDGAYYGDRGILYAFKGLTDKALEDFIFAAKYDSLNPARHFNLGVFYLDEGEIEKAVNHLNNCIKVAPNHLDARFKKAICSIILNQREEAIVGFTFLIENFEDQSTVLNPGNYYDILGASYYMRGGIYGEDKKYKLAIDDLKNAIKYKKDDPEIFNSLGYYLIFIDDIKQSLHFLDKSIKMQPTANNHNSRAYAYIKLKKYDLAEKDAKEAKYLDNKHPESYYNLALIYKEKGELIKACEHKNKAIELGLEKANEIIIEDCSE